MEPTTYYFLLTDMVPEDEVELRVTTSVKNNHGWVEVSHEKLIELSLTCTAHDARTGALLAKDLPVFWSKVSVASEFASLKLRIMFRLVKSICC